MDAFLKDLVEAHDLRTIGINFFSEPHAHFAVYLHWDTEDDTECCSGSGKTVDAALALALSEMAERQKQVADNAAEAAWCAQQERLMESGGPDDSAYRRDMKAAGRGHLLGG